MDRADLIEAVKKRTAVWKSSEEFIVRPSTSTPSSLTRRLLDGEDAGLVTGEFRAFSKRVAVPSTAASRRRAAVRDAGHRATPPPSTSKWFGFPHGRAKPKWTPRFDVIDEDRSDRQPRLSRRAAGAVAGLVSGRAAKPLSETRGSLCFIIKSGL